MLFVPLSTLFSFCFPGDTICPISCRENYNILASPLLASQSCRFPQWVSATLRTPGFDLVCLTLLVLFSAPATGLSEGCRGSGVDDVESFDHMLPLAVGISRHAGDVFEIDLPGAHRVRLLFSEEEIPSLRIYLFSLFVIVAAFRQMSRLLLERYVQ